ncbi:hypothetical protein FB451DRAFT_1172391 [Mycena latifolia]|nr:hypothetical protein FB451DRAFT_1172391 [Mycena latifolia]
MFSKNSILTAALVLTIGGARAQCPNKGVGVGLSQLCNIGTPKGGSCYWRKLWMKKLRFFHQFPPGKSLARKLNIIVLGHFPSAGTWDEAAVKINLSLPKDLCGDGYSHSASTACDGSGNVISVNPPNAGKLNCKKQSEVLSLPSAPMARMQRHAPAYFLLRPKTDFDPQRTNTRFSVSVNKGAKSSSILLETFQNLWGTMVVHPPHDDLLFRCTASSVVIPRYGRLILLGSPHPHPLYPCNNLAQDPNGECRFAACINLLELSLVFGATFSNLTASFLSIRYALFPDGLLEATGIAAMFLALCTQADSESDPLFAPLMQDIAGKVVVALWDRVEAVVLSTAHGTIPRRGDFRGTGSGRGPETRNPPG